MSLQANPTTGAPTTASNALVTWVFGALTLLFIAFIIYASWTPASGGGQGQGQGGLLVGFTSLHHLFRGHNLRDIATNILLYLPLGVFLALARSPLDRTVLSPWLLTGSLLSLVMELGQGFIGRTPDLVDLLTNTCGFLLGYLLIVTAIRRCGLSAMVFMGLDPNESQDSKTQSISAFRFLVVCIYVLVALLPLDVSVRLSDLYAQLGPDKSGVPKIILDPFYSISRWQQNGIKLTFEVWALLPIAMLTAFLGGLRGRLSPISPLLACLVVVFFCESAQIFVLSRTTDIVMVPIAIVAGLLGWLLVRTWFKVLGHSQGRSQRHSQGAEPKSRRAQWQQVALALLGYGLLICIFAWSPFRFESDLATVFEKIRHESNLVPFRLHFSSRGLGSALDIVKEAGLFLPLGVLWAKLLLLLRPTLEAGCLSSEKHRITSEESALSSVCEVKRSRDVAVNLFNTTFLGRWATSLLVAALCALFACFTELSQALVVGRYIDITDVILAAFGGLCGAMMLQLFEVKRFEVQRFEVKPEP